MALTNAEKFTLKPLSPNYFVGRQEQVYRILHNGLISRTSNLLNLQGPQKIGRTSLLHFIQFLAQTEGANTNYASLFKESTNNLKLLCLYIDLRLLTSGSREEIKSHFIRILARSLHEQSSMKMQETTFFRLMEDMSENSGYRYILFIDRAEYLLDQHIQENIKDTLGVLNDGLPNFGILLSFGASGELNAQDVIHRTAEIDQSIASISSLMNLVRYDIDIGLLLPEEAEQFLDDIEPTTFSQPMLAPFTAEEVKWIIEIAGTHPYLLNLLGILIRNQKQEQHMFTLSASELRKVEENALNQLKPFINNIGKRLSDLKDYKALELVNTLASSPEHAITIDSVSDDLARILEGEGLIQKIASQWVMPSSLMRKLLLEQLKYGNKSFANSLGVPVTDHTFAVQVDGISQTIELTEIETKVLAMLINASPDQLITRDDLLEGIWGSSSSKELSDQQKLSQRIKMLRNKLRPVLNENPIENVYGEGYRLIKPERFKLLH